jgi:opacity protein-like surface antigen
MRSSITIMLALVCAAASPALAQDESVRVQDGGIRAPGWEGRVDASEARNGLTVEDALLMAHGDGLHVRTGPAITYWNPANTATGDYTVRATFREERFMELNDHPHPYGIVVAGQHMGTDEQRFVYCSAYGSGTYIVRGFGPEPFQMNGRRGEEHAAVHRAAGQGQPVTQEIAVSVRGGKVECAINGTVVASYERGDVVTDGRLRSTDGVYGIRFAHNTEAYVTGLSVVRH